MCIPPWSRTFGAVFDSTTLMRRGYGCCAKYCAAARSSSRVVALAKPIMVLVFAFRGSALFRSPSLKSCICCMK